MKRTKIFALSSLIGVLFSSPAFAEGTIFTCEFTSWKGGGPSYKSKGVDVVKSWLGTSFVVDAQKGEITNFREEEQTLKPDIKETKKFTTYRYTLSAKDVVGNRITTRFSFRIYKTGKCTARMDSVGFQPINAKGTGSWK